MGRRRDPDTQERLHKSESRRHRPSSCPHGRVITPDIRDAERLQGFEPDWTKPAERVGRLSLRWSLIGNAVSVPVAEWLGRKLDYPGRYAGAYDRDLPVDGRWPKACSSSMARGAKRSRSPLLLAGSIILHYTSSLSLRDHHFPPRPRRAS